MFRIKFFLVFTFTIFLFSDNHTFGKSSIVQTKIIMNTTYYIVTANASVLKDYEYLDGKNHFTGKLSLVYNNLAGEMAISKHSYKDIPNIHNEKSKIYYLVKIGEEKKQSHKIYFNQDDIIFPNKTILNYNQKNKPSYADIYLILFGLFLFLSNFFNTKIIRSIISRMLGGAMGDLSANFISVKIRLWVQSFIIIVFFIGIHNIMDIGNEIKSYKGEWTANIEHIYLHGTSLLKEDLGEQEGIPLRWKITIFMLFIWFYNISTYQKKLFLPIFIHQKYIYLKVDPYDKNSYKLLSILDPEAYHIQYSNLEYTIFTDKRNRINVKSTAIFSFIIPSFILIWVLLKIIPSTFLIIIVLITIFLIVFIKNIASFKYICIFDHTAKKILTSSKNQRISFHEVFGLTLIYKQTQIPVINSDIKLGDKKEYHKKLFSLDLLLHDGSVIHLVANQNRDILLKEAKIISAYLQKPIFDLGKWNYVELLLIYKDTLKTKNNA